MSLPPPLVAGARTPEQARGIGVETLTIRPVASLPATGEEGQVVRLSTDGRLWSYRLGSWVAESATVPTYVHDQSASPLAVWVIPHLLGHRPAVKAVDMTGVEIIGEVTYTTLNVVTLTFLVPVAGYAYLT